MGVHNNSAICSHLVIKMKTIFSCIVLLAASANINAKAVPEPDAKPINGQYAPGPVSAALVAGPAKPYSFAHEVIDPAGGNAYGHRETSDGVTVEGEYRVVLPDSRTQIVTYSSSAATGYVAEVRYEGTPVFPDIEAAPKSERLQQRPAAADPRRPQQAGRRPQQGGRPINKRNENSTPAEFNNGPDVELKFFSDTN